VVSQPVLLSLVTSLIMTRLDYDYGLPDHLLDSLQSVLNAAAGLVCYAHKYDQRHTSSLGTPLDAGSGKNTISTGCTRFSMP